MSATDEVAREAATRKSATATCARPRVHRLLHLPNRGILEAAQRAPIFTAATVTFVRDVMPCFLIPTSANDYW
jgi:hypothetical protein